LRVVFQTIPAKEKAIPAGKGKRMSKNYNLSEAEIESAKNGDKAYRLYDGDGLYLQVTTSGSKYWRFKYRFGRKEKCLSMGTYPITGLEDARRNRNEAKELLTQGINPSEIRKQEKARIKAEHLEGERIPSVRISFDGKIEIWKGGNTLRLTMEEAEFIANILTNLKR
jgi:hypothetical protein